MAVHTAKRRTGAEREVSIGLSKVTLEGALCVPNDACGIAIFAHGSGSSRRSSRNRRVAGVLNQGAVATLLNDLLTEEEEALDLRTA